MKDDSLCASFLPLEWCCGMRILGSSRASAGIWCLASSTECLDVKNRLWQRWAKCSKCSYKELQCLSWYSNILVVSWIGALDHGGNDERRIQQRKRIMPLSSFSIDEILDSGSNRPCRSAANVFPRRCDILPHLWRTCQVTRDLPCVIHAMHNVFFRDHLRKASGSPTVQKEVYCRLWWSGTVSRCLAGTWMICWT